MLARELLLLLPTGLLAQAPTFHDGELAKVTSKVVGARAPFAGSVQCEIEVRNGTPFTCEPIVFALRLGKPQQLHRVERAPLPYAGRFGRGVASNGVQRYQLQFASTADPKSLTAAVVAASFHDQPPQSEPPIRVGALRQDTIRDGERTVGAVFVELANPGPLPVDVLMLGTFEQPFKGKALLTARLGPGAVTEAHWSVMPTGIDWTAAPSGTEGPRLRQLEVVDWTAVDRAPLADPAATAALLTAYDRWHRWPEPWPEGDGTFHAVYSRSNRQDGARTAIRGRFRLKGIAPPFVESEQNLDFEARQAVEKALDAAFADLRRPARLEFAARNALSLLDRDRFLVDGPGWPGQGFKLVAIQGDRIVGLQEPTAAASIWQQWTLEPQGDGYLVVGRETTQLALGHEPMEREHRSYARQGEWTVPLAYRKTTVFQGFAESIELTLACGELQRRGQPPPAGPGGPAAADLQRAWERGYRYPEAPTPLRARIEVAAGDDGIWLGERKVRGEWTMPDFRGFQSGGSGFRTEHVAVEHRDPGPLRLQLAAAVVDRLQLWAGRDFAGRPPFAVAFRGGTILAGDRPGVFAVGNCAIDEVEVANDFVVRVRWRDRLERRFDWQKLDDAMVPVRITSGDEVLSARWKRIDKSWYLPIELRFERVFGRDWGPETLALRDAALK